MASSAPRIAEGTATDSPRLSAGTSVVSGANTMPVPAWAMWLISLGSWLADESARGRRIWVALSVPVRDYAAAFVALGAVTAASRPAELPSPMRRFEELASLPPGTTVRYRSGKCIVKTALIEGCGPLGRSAEPAVRLSGGYSRVAAKCSDIEPLTGGESARYSDCTLADRPEFVEAALGVPDAGALTYHSKLACLMVGTKRSLHADLELPLAAGGHTGTLQDLVRCRSFLRRYEDGYLSDVMSALDVLDGSRPGDPVVAVLDGPNAILRWAGAFRAHAVACVIDRWHPSAPAARSALIARRARSAGDVPVAVACRPASIEVLGFTTEEGR